MLANFADFNSETFQGLVMDIVKKAAGGQVADNITNAKVLFLISLLGPIIALFLVVNRLVFRFRITGGMGLDDWTITLALTFLIVQSICTVVSIGNGYGRNSADVGAEDAKTALLFFWLLQIFYKLTINTVKLSILALYGRVFYFHTAMLRIVSVSMAIVLSAEVSFMCGTIFQCYPIPAAWDRSIVGHACTKTRAFWWSNAIWNIVSDVYLMVLPFFMLHLLNISRAKKVFVACMFSIGISVIITAILRFTTLQTASQKASFEPLSGTLISTTWTAGESALAIICANIPMLRQLLETCIPILRSSVDSTHAADIEIPEWATSRPRGDVNMDGTAEDDASVHALLGDNHTRVYIREPERARTALYSIYRSHSLRGG